ncbi:type II secretion system protein [Chloroflexota bacterium]
MKGEQGLTFVELLIIVAIICCVASVLGTAVRQLVIVPERGNERVTALHELQNVAHWFGIDGQMSVSASGGSSLTLTLYDDSTVTYSVQGADLNRVAGSSNRTLAQNISSANFTVQNRLITMGITSSPNGRWSISENGTYEVCMRPEQQ